MLAASAVYCQEQLLVDQEMFKMHKRAHRGIDAGGDKRLDEAIERIGPGGHFLNNHQPPPLHEGAERELDRVGEQARKAMEGARKNGPTDSEPEQLRSVWPDQSG